MVPGRICVVLSGTRKTGTLCDSRSTTPNTHGPSDTLPLLYFLLAPNLDLSISTVLPTCTPPSLISAFRILLEQIDLSALITVGFERLVSHEILLPEICVAHGNIKCSQVLNGMLDLSKMDPDLTESNIRHRLSGHMYPSFTRIVSATFISEPQREQC